MNYQTQTAIAEHAIELLHKVSIINPVFLLICLEVQKYVVKDLI